AAFIPFNGKSLLDAVMTPEGATSQVPGLIVADPQTVNAQRLDTNSPDPVYRAQLKSAFYGDLSDDAFDAIANLLTPDDPLQPAVVPITRTAGNWGSLKRHYVKCLQDNAVVPPMAQRMIDTADAEFPQNKTVVHTMNTSHSPFLSSPLELAQLLSTIALA
ncbi:MAG TPA: peptidase M13, partial [Burkholderiales bacterium]|nr:peptidase M13 [Burkholderiales bacterium]